MLLIFHFLSNLNLYIYLFTRYNTQKNRENWFLAYNFVWFWVTCYLTRSYYLRHSFRAKYFYDKLNFEVFIHDKDFAGK